MSNRTQEKRIVLIFTAFLMVFASSAVRASPTSDAQEQLNKAYDDYYDAVSKGGPKTPEEQKALRQKIVDPAMMNLNRAMKQETDQVVSEHAKGLPAAMSGHDAESGSSAPITVSTPEVSLDGSDIPKELEFPGKPKSVVNPAPIVSPPKTKLSPYLGPYAPPKSQ